MCHVLSDIDSTACGSSSSYTLLSHNHNNNIVNIIIGPISYHNFISLSKMQRNQFFFFLHSTLDDQLRYYLQSGYIFLSISWMLVSWVLNIWTEPNGHFLLLHKCQYTYKKVSVRSFNGNRRTDNFNEIVCRG